MMAGMGGRVFNAAVCAEPLERPRTSPYVIDHEEIVWVTRAKAGDEAAFRWLLTRYRPHVLRLAMHILRREGEAEDAAQEGFLRAFRKIGSFRSESRFSTWLYRIVVRVCLDRRRLARWQAEATSLQEDRSVASIPAQEAGDIETRLLVEQLLDRLSAPIRAALVLREIEGLEYSEIANVLGIPVGTVRSRLSAARAQFRTLWIHAMREDQDG